MQNKTKRKARVTPKRAEVVDFAGLSDTERAGLKLRADLHSQILKIVKSRKMSPADLQRALDQPQPRISELLNRRISKTSAEKLAGYLARLGISIRISLARTD